MKFVLPKLDTLLLKDAKANEEDTRKYVHVIKGHAVITNGVIVVVDLREYVKNECQITEENELEQLTEIINYLDGKSFPADYWKELTSEHFVSLLGDDKGLEIETLQYAKTLTYYEMPTSIVNIVDSLASNLNKPFVDIQSLAINFNFLNSVISCFKKEMKGLHLILGFAGQDQSVKFQIHKKDYIFGLIPLNYDVANEIMNFQNIKDYHKLICDSLID